MSESEFNLLNHLKNSKKQLETSEIETRRSLLKTLMDTNNNLVNQIWDINIKLGAVKQNDEEIKKLEAKRSELMQQLKEGDYSNKIDELTQAIHDLEMEANGTSDIGNSSPYKI